MRKLISDDYPQRHSSYLRIFETANIGIELYLPPWYLYFPFYELAGSFLTHRRLCTLRTPAPLSHMLSCARTPAPPQLLSLIDTKSQIQTVITWSSLLLYPLYSVRTLSLAAACLPTNLFCALCTKVSEEM
jgi:hypothetical protein